MKKIISILCAVALSIGVGASTTPKNPENAFAAPMDTSATAANYRWDNVRIGGGGGYIAGIVYNPTEEGLVYTRTDMGGVYRRDKETGDWISMMDWVSPSRWNLLGGESVATDPVEPNRVYIAAGTYTNNWTRDNGYILRSDDYGVTWKETEMPFKMGGNMPGRGTGERLAVDPNSNNILYFGARSGNGLWKSVDYGETWTKVTGIPTTGPFAEDPNDQWGYQNDQCGLTWVTFDKSSGTAGSPSQKIYVGAADKDCPIFMSDDGGKTWKAMTDQPTNAANAKNKFKKLNSEADALSIGIPHHGVITSTGVLYVTYGDRSGPYQVMDGAVWKCDTKTNTWTDITPYMSRNYGWTTLPDGSSGQGYTYEYPNYFGFGGLAVDPQNPDSIMVASLQSWWPDNYIFRSNDGGVTWNNSGSWSSYPARDLNYTLDISAAPWLDWGKPLNGVNGGEVKDGENPNPKLGWMIEAMAINPFNPDEMMYGTGATLYRTDNATVWDDYTYDYDVWPVKVTKPDLMHIYSAANGIEETAVLDLIVPPVDGVKLISALGDINGFVHDDVTKPQKMMSSLVFTSCTGIDYAELNPNIIVRVGNGDEDQYTPTKHIIAVSKDGGKTWSEGPQPAYANGITWDGIPEGGGVAVSANGASYVWSPSGNNPVVVILDGTIKKTNLPNNAYVVSDRVNPDIFYATSGGTFYKSTDKGATFTKVSEYGEYGNAKINAVPGFEGHVWMPYYNETENGNQGGMLLSTDGGANWTEVVANRLVSPVDVERSPSDYYASVVGFGKGADGTDYPAVYMNGKVDRNEGVFRSDDMGETWIRINDDAHQYGSNNYAITGDMREFGTVYYGANGRGIIMGVISDDPNTDPNNTTPTTKTTTPTTVPTTPINPDALYGDVNLDDEVNTADLILLAKVVGGKAPMFTGKALINANCNKGEGVNGDDLLALIKFLVNRAIVLPL